MTIFTDFDVLPAFADRYSNGFLPPEWHYRVFRFFHSSGERENSGVRRFAAGCKTVFFSPSPISNRDFLIRQKSLRGPPSSP